MRILKKVLKWLGIILLMLIGGILLLGLVPAANDGYPANPNPLADYDEAAARVEALLEEELPVANENGRSIFLTTGAKTEDAYLLIHGLSNSPKEFEELGQMLLANGHNVLILRMPYHGLESLHIREVNPLTPEDLRAYGDEVVDIAAGLGENVHVIGISGGGAVGAWIIQNRDEVRRAALLAPFFGIKQVPTFLDSTVKNALLRLPPLYIVHPRRANRFWMYSGESGRGAAVFMDLSQTAAAQAAAAPPAVRDILILTSASDQAVDNAWSARVAEDWRAQGAAVATHEFEQALAIPHASIDPFVEPEKRQLVYEQLFAWLGEEMP